MNHPGINTCGTITCTCFHAMPTTCSTVSYANPWTRRIVPRLRKNLKPRSIQRRPTYRTVRRREKLRIRRSRPGRSSLVSLRDLPAQQSLYLTTAWSRSKLDQSPDGRRPPGRLPSTAHRYRGDHPPAPTHAMLRHHLLLPLRVIRESVKLGHVLLNLCPGLCQRYPMN